MELTHEELIQGTVDIESEGKRVDLWLAEQEMVTSRSHGQQLISQGLVLVGGKKVKANYRLHSGEQVEVKLPSMVPLEVLPESIPLEIVYQDKDLAVVNKPAGMVVHPAEGNFTGTLVNALLYHLQDLSGINGVLRPGIVHRIDKDTSGLLVVAKHDQAHIRLAEQVKEHMVKRHYWALVHGIVEEVAGRIEAPLGRDNKDRQKMAVREDGRSAITHYVTRERYREDRFSLVECQLETGRTHQIRVHMAYLGHPVAGDPKYGPRKAAFNLSGQALHAFYLHFAHPMSGEPMSFFAPARKEIVQVINLLRARNSLSEKAIDLSAASGLF